jgi:GNAT superfamily N-acetyltransferase
VPGAPNSRRATAGATAEDGDKGSAVTIRRVCPQDLTELVALCIEHADFERVPYDAVDKAVRLRTALFAASPRLYAWVAVGAEQNLIGYATAAAEYSTWSAREYLHMDCLFVRTARRGAGVGARLLDSVMRFAREHGYHEVQWQTPHWNVDASRFYRRHGGVDQHKLRFVASVTNAFEEP